MPFDGVASPFNYLAGFDRVIELVEAPGRWTKHTYRGPGGRSCLKEALSTVGIAEVFEPIILKVAETVTEREFCCIESFNDHPLTTHRDVLEVLRRTRDGIIAGAIEVPAPAGMRPAPRWNRCRVPRAGGAAGGFWAKLFRWS